MPNDSGVTVTTDPVTVTGATPGFDDAAVNSRNRPSKALSTRTRCGGCPSTSSRSSRLPTGLGAPGFRTVTSNVWVACPALFVAVTVTVVMPSVTGVTATTDPDTVTDAMPGFDETAVNSRY